MEAQAISSKDGTAYFLMILNNDNIGQNCMGKEMFNYKTPKINGEYEKTISNIILNFVENR